jgi:membrane fusion protein, heavy metal efflux system
MTRSPAAAPPSEPVVLAGAQPAHRTSYVWLAGPGLIALAVLLWFAWFRGAPRSGASDAASAPADTVTLSPSAARSSGIVVQTPQWIERVDRIDASGIIALNERRTARPGAIVEGVILDVNAQTGDRVASGAVLATIHSHVVHDAWAAYFKGVAERRRFENEVRYARAAEERAARLLADKALSPQEVDRARSDRIAAEQGLTAARAEETRASQELEHYGIVARETGHPEQEDIVSVRAPFAGALIERQVSPGSAVTPGTPLFVVSDLSLVWVTAEVDEAQVARIVPGLPVEVDVTAYPGEVFRGTLASVGDMVNPSTRRVTIRCEVPNADGRLKAQMFARVTLKASTPRHVLVISARAIQTMEGQTIVFVRDSLGRFQRRPIVIGSTVGGLAEIVSGADEDDEIATAGAFLIKSELLQPQVQEP